MSSLHLIPDPHRLDASLHLAQEYDACFEYNDFFDPALLDDPERCRTRIAMYRKLDRDRSCDTLHGTFFDIAVHSGDPRIREVSELRIFQSMEAAKELGVRAVIFHTGIIPNYRSAVYADTWLRLNMEFWKHVVESFPGIGILMENMFDMTPDLLLRLAEEMKDVPAFGICLDYAHAFVFGKEGGGPKQWLSLLAPHIRHLHLNDNDGCDDLHLAAGDGRIDWAGFDTAIRQLGLHPSVLIEVKEPEKQRKSLEYLRAQRIYPFS